VDSGLLDYDSSLEGCNISTLKMEAIKISEALVRARLQGIKT
jgi:hypothetical protein